MTEKISKILFLDIDGVLNSHQSADYFHRVRGEWNPYEEFCPISVGNLCTILEEVPDLKIIMSSTWRIGIPNLEKLKEIFDALPTSIESSLIKSRLIDKTPVHRDSPRGLEIQEWVDVNKDKLTKDFRMVILDDDSDMAHLKPHLIQTNGVLGLTLLDAQKAIRVFKSDLEVRKDKMDEWARRIYLEALGRHKEIAEIVDDLRDKIKELKE